MSPRIVRTSVLLPILSATGCRPPVAANQILVKPTGNGPVHLTFVSLADLSRTLEPESRRVGLHAVEVGGFDSLQGYVRVIRSLNPNTVIIASGAHFPDPAHSGSIRNEMTLGVLNSLNLSVAFTDEFKQKSESPSASGLVSGMEFQLASRTTTLNVGGIKLGIIAANADDSAYTAAGITDSITELRNAGCQVIALLLNDMSRCDDPKLVGQSQVVCRNGDPIERLVTKLPEGGVDAVITENSYSSSARGFRGIPIVKNSHPGVSFNRIDLWVKPNSPNKTETGERVVRFEAHRPEFVCSAQFERYNSCEPQQLAEFASREDDLGRFGPAIYQGMRITPGIPANFPSMKRSASSKPKSN